LFLVFNWLPVNCVREIEILISLIGICFKIQGHYIEIVYASKINIKVIWKPKNFFVSFGKTIYIMIILVAQYLLVGVVIAFILEAIIRWTDQEVTHLERLTMIAAWPLMAIIFVYNFIVGMFS